MRGLTALFVAACAAPGTAFAAPICRSAEIRFAPGAPDLQIVVWIEDARGAVVDTPYITRVTGQFGLANRPGEALLKTDFRWPFGRRVMVAPVWAHRRGKKYPQVVMGGACGNSLQSKCPNGQACGGDCEDSTIAYHSLVSSYEPFYCSPSGPSRIDAMSCASKGTFPKGAYADPPAYSLYPPRADLNGISPQADSPDALDFAKRNDLAAVSRATPSPNKTLAPPVTWFPAKPLPDGDYVAWIELSQESDFNQDHRHPNKKDTVLAWDFEGHPFLGQPSVLYKVPFKLGPQGGTFSTAKYAGYGDWDGGSYGVNDVLPRDTMHAVDGTISDQPGSGAGRLLDLVENGQSYRFQVVVGQCAIPIPPDGGAGPEGGVAPDAGPLVDAGPARDGGVVVDAQAPGEDSAPPPECLPPDPANGLRLAATPTAIEVRFKAPSRGAAPVRYEIRYREGSRPFSDRDFLGVAAPDLEALPGPGDEAVVRIRGLVTETAYTVGVRSFSACNEASPVASDEAATPAQNFTTLKGCFVATAAYGSPMAAAVKTLRQVRDRQLLDNPAGRLFVASYYALSQPLASAIASDARLRRAARGALSPFVAVAERLPR